MGCAPVPRAVRGVAERLQGFAGADADDANAGMGSVANDPVLEAAQDRRRTAHGSGREGCPMKLWERARGHWDAILAEAKIPAEVLDGRHHKCPECGGKDRFRYLRDEEGGFF